jgi:hypothetical protein
VLEFRPDFPNTFGGLAAESNALLDEIKESNRYKTAMRKEKKRSEEKAKLRDKTMTDSPRTTPNAAKPKPTRS